MDLGSLEFGIALLAAAASIITWRVLPVAYAAFATVFCLIALSGGSTVSVWRHVYLIFPIFMLAARGGAASLLFDRTYVALSLILAGLFITLRATGWAMVA
jgi:hypothetical protein